MPGSVGSLERKNHDESRVVGSGKIVADQTTGTVASGEEGEAEGARYIGEQEEDYEIAAGLETFARYLGEDVSELTIGTSKKRRGN